MPQPLRIFISSPGDVMEERRRAALVISRLKREFARFLDLSAVLWEYEPMLASGHFQDVIERPSATDLVVLILWSRLGTRLPEDRYRGLDGRIPVTGTEWEYEEALAAQRARGTPDILVYRKRAEAVARFSRQEELEAARVQWLALQDFWERHFAGADGTFKTAFNSFDDLDAFEALLEGHLRELLRRRLSERRSGPEASAIIWHQGSPFRGLEVFEPEHAAVFFGRERAEREVIEALARNAEAGCAFLLVLGASGSGKSSLVRAGVLPNLMAPGVVTGVEAWRYCMFRPGQAMGDLAEGLARALVEQPRALPELEGAGVPMAVLAEQFRSAPNQVALPVGVGLARVAARPGAARLVLVADQMEELFTLPQVTAGQRRGLVLALEALARSGLVWVVATLRSDFYHRCAELPELRDLAAGERQYHLLAPRPAELEPMIRRPAAAAGLGFEADPDGGPGLDGELTEAAGRDPGSLPLLSFTLDELYRRDVAESGGEVLTFASYRALGGLEGAIAERAEEVAAEVCRPQPEVLEAVLRALVAAGEDGAVTARIAARAEVASSPERALVLDGLVAARLVVAAGDAAGATVRLAHEALLTRWPRLRELVEADREFLQVRGRLMADRVRWNAEGHPDDLLLPAGKRLAEAEEVLAGQRAELDAETAAYVERSIDLDRKGRERRLRQVRLVAVGMALLALLAVGFGWRAYDRSLAAEVREQEASAERDKAQTATGRLLGTEAQRRLAEPITPDTSPLIAALATAGWRLGKASDAWNAMQRVPLVTTLARITHDDAVQAVAFSPDGQFLATASGDHLARKGQVRLVAVADGREIARITHDDAVQAVAFSPDGQYLATASQDGIARLVAVADGREIARITHDGPVQAITFSPDGQYLATASRDQTARLVAVADGREIARITHDGAVQAITFSPDGQFLATASEDLLAYKGEARLVAVADGREIARITHDNEVNAVAFSPDGQYLATASRDQTARLVAVADGREIARITHDNEVNAVAFSPDGQYLATASVDRTARLVAVADGREIARITHDNEVWGMAFSPDGQYLATASADQTARLVAVADGREIARITHDNEVNAVAFSPDGKTLATASADRTAQLVAVADGREIARITHDNLVEAMAFSPDGKTLATASADQTARLVAVADGREIARITHDKVVWRVAFSPDGQYLATASADQTARLVAVADGREIARITHDNEVQAITFSPDGKTLATASEDLLAYKGEARLVAVADGREIVRITHGGPIGAVAFSPDGQFLATASQDGIARLVAVADGREIARITHDGAVNAITFSPDGKTLATASRDQTARLVAVADGREIARITHDNEVQAITFSPDGKTLATASQDGIARLVAVADGREIARITHDNLVEAMAFSPDGQYLATASVDRTARLVAVVDGREIAHITHDGAVKAITFSPDGQYLATASVDRTARLVAVVDGREIARITHNSWINAVAFSPDGQFLATAASQDGIARLVAVADGREIARITHDGAVKAITFSPDGQYLATASADQTARLVAVADGREIARITHNDVVWAVAFSPDGKQLATASLDKTVRLWSTALDDMLHQLCTGHGRNLSHSEWRRHLGDLPWQPTCESWPTPKE